MRYTSLMGSNRGVSLLLEAVFGFGLFAMAILVVFGLFPSTHNSTTLAKNLTLANGICQEIIEQQRALPYASIASVARAPFVGAPISTIDGNQSRVTFNVEIIVTVDPLAGVPDRKRILVRVDWADARIVHKVELETYAVERS